MELLKEADFDDQSLAKKIVNHYQILIIHRNFEVHVSKGYVFPYQLNYDLECKIPIKIQTEFVPQY